MICMRRCDAVMKCMRRCNAVMTCMHRCNAESSCALPADAPLPQHCAVRLPCVLAHAAQLQRGLYRTAVYANASAQLPEGLYGTALHMQDGLQRG
jgi:hypothetical protein